MYVSPLFMLAGQMGGARGRLTIIDFLCKAEIYQFQMALGIYEDVFGLQVSVSNTFLFVEELQNQHYFGGVKLRGRLVEPACSAQIAEDLTAGAVIELRGSVSKRKTAGSRRRN